MGRIYHLATLLLALTLGFRVMAFSQTVFETYLESEEEIQEAYQGGELTYEQYLDLLDLYFDKLDPREEDLSRLEVVPGATESDLDRIRDLLHKEVDFKQVTTTISRDLDLRRFLPFLNLGPAARRETNLYAYWQTNLELAEAPNQPGEDRSYSQIRLRLKPHYEIFLQGEKRHLNRMEVSKRYVKVRDRGVFRELVLGNFTAGYGNGLNLGRYDYWRYNTDSYWDEEGDFLIPNSTWHNGIKASLLNGKLRPDLIYSYYEADSLKRNFLGVNLSWEMTLLSPGITYSVDVTEDERGGQLRKECISLHGRLSTEATEISAETALLNWDYTALDLRLLVRREFYTSEFAVWVYSNNFVNFHASSRANPDYFTVYFEEVDYNFRSPQAGEIGFSSSNRFRVTDRLHGRADFSGWGNRVRKTNNHDLQAGLIARLSETLSLRLDQFVKGRDNQEEPYESYTSQIEIQSRHLEDFPIQGKISYNLKDYQVTGTREYAYFWLRLGILTLRPLEIFSRIKYVNQEFKYATKKYCEFYLEESLDFWEALNLSAKYRANYRGLVAENKEIRVRLQALW